MDPCMFFRRAFVLCLLLSLSLPLSADTRAIVWDGTNERVPIESNISYQVDASGAVGIGDILASPPDAWTRLPDGPVSLGYSSAAHWFRVPIVSPSPDVGGDPYLEISYAVLNHIDLFLVQDGQIRQQLALGSKLPHHQRPINHPNFVVPLALTGAEESTLYLRVRTSTAIQVPMVLWEPEAMHDRDRSQMLFEGMYYGIALVMVLYHLFVFIAVGERTFLYYVGYIASMPLFLLAIHGIAFQYLWPYSTWWNNQAMMFFLNGVVLFGALFTMRFISVLPPEHPRLHKLLLLIVSLAALLMAASLVIPFGMVVLPSIALAFIGCCFILFLGLLRLFKGDPEARYYTVAWGAMLLGGITLALSKFTVLPRNLFTENATQVGSALGVILLSIALANRLNKEKTAAFEAQQQAFREERKVRIAQEESLRVQQEANLLLEERVKERTSELETANDQLLMLSSQDSLTGLRNRRFFEDAFQSEYMKALRYRRPLALMVLDIDHFKAFNDTYGHLIGDECLKMVAGIIEKGATRPADLAVRFGGEEFVVVLPETSEAGAMAVAERIRKEVETTPFQVPDAQIQVTLSIGVVSRIPTRVDDSKTLFEEADQALYDAKAAGRNRVMLSQGTETGAPQSR